MIITTPEDTYYRRYRLSMARFAGSSVFRSLWLGNAAAIGAGIVVPRQTHLILTCRSDATILVLPVAHAFCPITTHTHLYEHIHTAVG